MFENITAGRDIPNDINVIIEIAAQSTPIKYELDKESGLLAVDRFLSTAMCYPCDYGFIPKTLSEDGDPLDVLVIAPYPLRPKSMIRCRPIGMLEMEDESGIDAKILMVPIDKLTPIYRDVKTPHDLGEDRLQVIAHFFEHYKDLEKGKWVKVKGWKGIESAIQEIQAGVSKYQD